MDVTVDRFRFIKENKLLILGLITLVFVLIFVVRLILGYQNCNITKLKGGVLQKCDCTGLEVTVKITSSSGEQKTVCLGRISNKITY